MIIRKTEHTAAEPAVLASPRHVAIIMDGNRRWARERGLPLVEGYRRGIIALREVTRGCTALGVPILTVYGFSTENWKRDDAELSVLFELCCAFARNELAGLIRENVRVRLIGHPEELPPAARRALTDLVEKTSANTGTVLNLAVNYSARAELGDAARALAIDVASGSIAPSAIDDDTIARYLHTRGMPDPDLLIRPGGEARLSNFLLYQLAYTELWLTDVYWPDFTRETLALALAEFAQRARRFGGA
ncbi:MAG TPA: polyprenyl diphosphate synthase [Candidatus Eremiobacteraceae bacterium]|nr:polyprenyl diphosphate synthase [Candidatus Eremiobacteraceae bacterium]